LRPSGETPVLVTSARSCSARCAAGLAREILVDDPLLVGFEIFADLAVA
jgi:hypothetical protein